MENIKTIYILWTKRLNLQRGGVHRIISILMENLPEYGYNVEYLYTEDRYNTFYHYQTDKSEQVIPQAELRQYLIKNHCDLLIGQDGCYSHKLSTMVKEWHMPDMKYITVFHSTVLLMEKCFSCDYWKWLLKQDETSLKIRISSLLRIAFYPFWLRKCRKSVRDNFLLNYDAVDALVLLSKEEIPEIQKLTKTDISRCRVINNPLSWENIEDFSVLERKKKEVLIVSRLYNPEKRIDRALKIWKKIEERGHKDWILRIVGAGVHEDYLKRLADKLKLQNVVFEGSQNSYPYYISASLFMMTSVAEGWGLTLTESMQMGVVPIAFDSYPALKDIITDGYDGCIIEEDNLVAYADRVEYMMLHPEECKKIARNGLESCRRFTIDKIMEQWVNLIEEL